MLHGASGELRTFRDGRFTTIEPWREGREVAFPLDGTYTVYPIGHPEPITLPRVFPAVRSVSNFGALYPPQLNDLIAKHARRVDAGEVDPFTAADDWMREITANPQQWLAAPPGVGIGGLLATATGLKDGRRVRVACELAVYPENGMTGATGIPLAIAVDMLIRGRIKEKGVLTPDSCLDPDAFLAEYATRCGQAFTPPVAEVIEELA